MDTKLLVDLAGSERKIFQVLEVLELGSGHTLLEISVTELNSILRGSVVPTEN